MLNALGRLLSRISDSAALLAGLIVALMIVHITLDVILRFAFNLPIGGTILFVSLMYMPCIVFLPLAFAEKRDAHISVELVYDRLPKTVQRVLDFLSHSLSVVIFAALAYRTWSEALSKLAIGASEMEGSLRIPVWPSYFVLPVGFALLVAVLAYRIACLIGRRQPTLSTGVLDQDTVEETSSV